MTSYFLTKLSGALPSVRFDCKRPAITTTSKLEKKTEMKIMIK